MIIGKYSTELNLTPEQAERFFPRFRQFQNQAETLQRDQMGRREELERFSQQPGAEPNQVNRILSEQASTSQQITELKQQFLGDVSSFLTPQQVSRCSILMDDIPRRVHEYIDAQKRAGRAPNQGYGPNSGPRGGESRQGGDRPRRRGR